MIFSILIILGLCLMMLTLILLETNRMCRLLKSAINDDSELNKELHEIYKKITQQNQILMSGIKRRESL